MNFFEKLKARWGLTSNWQVFVVIFVFGATGSLSVKVAAPVLDLLGIHDDLNPFIYWPLRILIVFPVYQVMLISIGALCGQFTFFWNFEKKMLGRMIGRGSRSK